MDRNILQWAKEYGSKIKKGEKYKDENLPKVHTILIVDYNLEKTKQSKSYDTSYGVYADKENYNEMLKITDRLEGNIIELKKYRETGDTKKDEWIRFIKAKGMSEMAKIITKNPILEKAKKEYEYLVSDPSRRAEFEAREMELYDIITICSEYQENGRAEGIKEVEERIILNMYAHNISVKDISKLVGIDKKKVQKIVDEASSEKLILVK